VFIRAGFEHFLTFDAKPQQYEDWVSNPPQNYARTRFTKMMGAGVMDGNAVFAGSAT